MMINHFQTNPYTRRKESADSKLSIFIGSNATHGMAYDVVAKTMVLNG